MIYNIRVVGWVLIILSTTVTQFLRMFYTKCICLRDVLNSHARAFYIICLFLRCQWYPEIRHHCPDTPVVLVGTKTDMRQSARKGLSGKDFVPKERGMAVTKQIGALKYMECSALDGTGLHRVFEEATRAARYKINNPKKKRKCTIL